MVDFLDFGHTHRWSRYSREKHFHLGGNPNNPNKVTPFKYCSVRILLSNVLSIKAPPPDPSNIKSEDLLGVTVILLTCSYRQREFIRVGYFVYNHLSEVNGMPVQLAEGERPDSKLIYRIINASEPRYMGNSSCPASNCVCLYTG
jgi:hypothetical protein